MAVAENLAVARTVDQAVAEAAENLARSADLAKEIPFEFWRNLKEEILGHPFRKEPFRDVYERLLDALIKRSAVIATEDPFQAAENFNELRSDILEVVEDCVDILTADSALEQVLKSFEALPQQDVAAREAHLHCLTVIGDRHDDLEGSGLLPFVESLPALILEELPEDALNIVLFLKDTAIQLLGSLVESMERPRRDLLKSALVMASTVLSWSPPSGGAPASTNALAQVHHSAALLYKRICRSDARRLEDFAPQVIQTCIATMHLPFRTHMVIVEGVTSVVVVIEDDGVFEASFDKLVVAFVDSLTSAMDQPQVLTEAFDRLTALIRDVDIESGTAKASSVGTLINSKLWPLIRQAITQHPSDAEVAEKSCRLLKHSMRCVPTSFKQNVPDAATMLGQAFQEHQHPSYLYSSEVLASTYASETEIVPVLTQLFHITSGTALQHFETLGGDFKERTELIEDFFGMFTRYTRKAPLIVSQAPTLAPTLQLCSAVIGGMHRDAIESVSAFVEEACGAVADNIKSEGVGEDRLAFGKAVQPDLLKVAPDLVTTTFRIIANMPWKHIKESVPRLLESVQDAFPDEFSGWLVAAFTQLPEDVAKWAKEQHIGAKLSGGDAEVVDGILQSMCFQCSSTSAARAVRDSDMNKIEDKEDQESNASTEKAESDDN